MSSLNKAQLIGRLGKDPEVKKFANGGCLANAALATSERWTDRQSGQKQEKTEWHRLVFRDRLTEIAGQYLKKGSLIYVEGKIATRKWQGQDGRDNYTIEINVWQMQMLSTKAQDGAQGQQQALGDKQDNAYWRAKEEGHKPPKMGGF